MILTTAFFGTAYTSLTTLLSDGGGGRGSSSCEYVFGGWITLFAVDG